MTPTDHDDVLVLERRFWTEGGGDPAFWRTHFASEGLVALSFGVMDKDQTVDAMGRAQPWRAVEMTDPRVRSLGDHAVLLTYRADAVREDDSTYAAVVGSVYVRYDGDWQLAFHQQSPVAG